MKTYFADTFYFIALLSTRDASHARAVDFSLRVTARLVTTDYVLAEVGDAISKPTGRFKFAPLVKDLHENPIVNVVASSRELFKRGVELYHRRLDKNWSLTDCISFVVMNDHGLTEALTGDVHFKQAGFVPLFASS